MTDIALQTGLRALLAARYTLDTIGHNLANANTPGYSRQSVSISTAAPFLTRGLLIGGGVEADRIQRTVDELLGKRILGQYGVGGGLEAQLGLLSEIEASFGEPGAGGLSGRFDAFWSSIAELSAAPSDAILRGSAVQTAEGLTERFRQLTQNLQRVRTDAIGEARTRVAEANGLAARIASLNGRITESEGSGVTANDLRDERERLVGELARLVDVQTVEDRGGALRVLVAGHTLVGRTRVHSLSAATNERGELVLRMEGASGDLPARGGALGGLLGFRGELVTRLSRDLDQLAHEFILEANRVHSTGLPAAGPFTELTGTNALVDRDGDGRLEDELLSRAGLPFDVQSGSLDVNVTNAATGRIEKTRLSISATHTTVGELLEELNAIDGLSAELDTQGRVRISAEPGFAFDFSSRIDPAPDRDGVLGGSAASLGSAGAEPFVLADGDTLELRVDNGGGPLDVEITFDAADFRSISQASAEEIAAVVNADPAAQAAGLRAVTNGGRVFLQSVAQGSGVSLELDGGSALGALGWSTLVGTPLTGHEHAVDVQLGGAFNGGADTTYRLQPRGDGTIGTTPGLLVDVFDGEGRLVATLDVGAGYVPGEELALADGLTVRFGLGELSATSHDALTVEAVVDSDSSDVLVALGLNALFTGHDAGTIGVRADLADDPALLSTSLSGASGDNAPLLRLLDLQDADVDGLGGVSLGRFYGGIVSDLGFDVSVATDAWEANQTLVASLEQRRDSVSGVNVDEELVQLVEYEQAFAAAAQYITVVNQLGEEILSLI